MKAVRFNRGALKDLDEIFSYIAARNPAAAVRVVARIEHVAALIGHSPDMGRDTKRAGLKKFPVESYLIVYEVTAEDVIVHYVRDGRRRRPWEGE
jgi:addiction module RelE/StbE family toxin